MPPFEEVAQDRLAAAAAEAAAAAPGSSSIGWSETGSSSGAAAVATDSSGLAGGGPVYCYGCLKGLDAQDGAGAVAAGQAASLVLRCGQCRQLYCFDCDAFIHESLHNCPGCECCPIAGVTPGPEV